MVDHTDNDRWLDVVLREGGTYPASRALRGRILAAVPGQGGWQELIASLWPFGPVWRPAAGLAGIAMIGIMIGTTDLLSQGETLSVNGVLSEEIHSVALGVSADSAQEDFIWQE